MFLALDWNLSCLRLNKKASWEKANYPLKDSWWAQREASASSEFNGALNDVTNNISL